MSRRPPLVTRPVTLFPYTTLCLAFGAAIPAFAADPSRYALPVRFGPLCVPIVQDARKAAQREHDQRLLAPHGLSEGPDDRARFPHVRILAVERIRQMEP